MQISGEGPISDPGVIRAGLMRRFKVNEISVDPVDFTKFYSSVAYPSEYEKLFGAYLKEKILEHYVSILLLNFSPGDRFIDIAASHSHFSEYILKKGIESYKQDLIYPNGVSFSPDSNVPLIGGNAADLLFKDNYFSKMTLHCSIEHFESEDDIAFFREAHRVLRAGGKICTLPLYFGETYHLVTDPDIYATEKGTIRFEGDIPVYMKKGFNNRHCRVYTVEKFQKRIANPELWDVEIYHITNLCEIGNGLYCEYAAVHTKR